MRRAPGLLVGLLTLALTVTGCSSSGDGGDPESRPTSSAGTDASPAPAAANTVNPSAELTEERLTELFAGAGISTYAEPGDAEPVVAVTDPGPVQVSGWQLSTMTRQLASGRGYLGRDLDALTADTGAGPQPVPVSVVLAAWLSASQTPGADVARELVGEKDWANDALDLTYPDAVLTLFTADLVRDSWAAAAAAQDAAPVASPAAYVVAAAPAALEGVCSQVSAFVSDTFKAVVQTLKFEADNGETGLLGTIWNTIVDYAASVAQIALSAVTSTLTAPIQKIATIIALLSNASSLLNPWQVTMDVEPGGNLQPGTSAEVTATVDAGGKTWPGNIADCAQVLLNVKLPEPGDAQGSEATFSVDDFDKTITYGQTATTVDAAQQAKLPFSTLPEDPSLASGKETLHYVAFGVKVKRAQVGELTALIDGLLVVTLPEPVLSLMKLILGPVESAAREKLSELASVDGPVASLLTVRHEPPEEVPPVPPTPEETCAVGAAADGIPDGTWTGPIDMDVVGSGADMGGSIKSAGGGTMTITSAKGKVSGTWDIAWSSKGTLNEDGVSVKLAVNGKVDGTAAGKAVQPRLDYSYSIKGTATVSTMGITQKVPIDETGSFDQFLTIVDSNCDGVVATFVPSFNSKANPAGIQFTGKATWHGSPA